MKGGTISCVFLHETPVDIYAYKIPVFLLLFINSIIMIWIMLVNRDSKDIFIQLFFNHEYLNRGFNLNFTFNSNLKFLHYFIRNILVGFLQTLQTDFRWTGPATFPRSEGDVCDHARAGVHLRPHHRGSQPQRVPHGAQGVPGHQSHASLNPGVRCYAALLLPKHGGRNTYLRKG